MLLLPEKGVRASRASHNSDLHLFCDWLEGCLLFKREQRLSRTDIIDILCEQAIYEDQTFASEWLDNVWAELTRRHKLLAEAAPFDVEPRVITRSQNWEEVPSYSFCILVPLLRAFRQWRATYDPAELARHYVRQGGLFERISDEALRGSGWQTHRPAWSREKAERLPAVVSKVAQQIGEPECPNWVSNVSPNANEAGLDIVFFRPFSDQRTGFPIYLTQCAAGDDWDTKLHTPVLEVWRKLVDFAAPPQKAFAVPHSLDAEEFRRTTVRVAGIVFDRYRLHDSSRPLNWCSSELAEELRDFLSPLIARLPSYN